MAKTREMTEAQMVGLVRNALLVAGHEMGENGEHWPVINATIHSIAKDWEESKIQKEVDVELKTHLYHALETMEKELPTCTPEEQAEFAPKLKELREIYDSYFAPADKSAIAAVREDEIPVYLKRAEAIIATLGEKHV